METPWISTKKRCPNAYIVGFSSTVLVHFWIELNGVLCGFYSTGQYFGPDGGWRVVVNSENGYVEKKVDVDYWAPISPVPQEKENNPINHKRT